MTAEILNFIEAKVYYEVYDNIHKSNNSYKNEYPTYTLRNYLRWRTIHAVNKFLPFPVKSIGLRK